MECPRHSLEQGRTFSIPFSADELRVGKSSNSTCSSSGEGTEQACS